MNQEHNPYTPPKADLGDESGLGPQIRPRSVEVAVVLLGITILLAVVRLVSSIGVVNMGAVSPLYVLGQTIGVALWIWLCFAILRGRNWARILALVLTVIGMLSLGLMIWSTSRLFGARFFSGMEDLGMTFLPTLLTTTAMYLLFVPGRAWFAPREY